MKRYIFLLASILWWFDATWCSDESATLIVFRAFYIFWLESLPLNSVFKQAWGKTVQKYIYYYHSIAVAEAMIWFAFYAMRPSIRLLLLLWLMVLPDGLHKLLCLAIFLFSYSMHSVPLIASLHTNSHGFLFVQLKKNSTSFRQLCFIGRGFVLFHKSRRKQNGKRSTDILKYILSNCIFLCLTHSIEWCLLWSN